ncbi:MAG: helix-turn-helix domain-containing protein [Armatimonadetes bacterium]|nr:helix-turn-helix domain-containing protein [Armatimonadota bacterium]
MLTVPRALRLKRGLTAREVAKNIRVTESLMSKFETRQAVLPKRARPELAKIYGVPEERLFDKFGLARMG